LIDINKSVEEFIKHYEKKHDISKVSNTKIADAYYSYIGVDCDISINDWLIGIAFGKYPKVNDLKRSIREVRKKNPKWIRKEK